MGVLPARSPMPAIVVCTTLAPAATARTVFATPRPKSMCMWVSSGTSQRSRDALAKRGDGVRPQRAHRVDQRQRVHVAGVGDLADQADVVLQRRARGVDREERDQQPLLVGVRGGLDRRLDRALDRPAVALLDEMAAGRHLHDHAGHAAVHGALDVVDHAARERVDRRRQPRVDDHATAFSSSGETAGRPASIRWIPASASPSAMRSFCSAVNSTPACCSPSRSVTSWIVTCSGKR